MCLQFAKATLALAVEAFEKRIQDANDESGRL